MMDGLLDPKGASYLPNAPLCNVFYVIIPSDAPPDFAGVL